MHRSVGYTESGELAYLIDQLREQLATEPLEDLALTRELETVLGRLVTRNQRLRVLQRLMRAGGSVEHMAAIREALEQVDAELLRDLPALLEHLRAAR